MADDKQTDSPKLVWTFPLVTRIQKGSRFLDIGSNIGTISQMGGGVGSRVQERVAGSQDDDPSVSGYGEDEDINEVENELSDLRESAELTFGQDSEVNEANLDNGVETVDIEDGVFIPTRVSIDPGDTVEWVNNDDSVHKLSSIEGETFTSPQIEPDELFEHTFDESGTTIYIDSIAGGEQMSGAVIVGDGESPDTLPSETEQDPVLFDEQSSSDEDNSGLGTRSMSVAAEEKDNMEVGFSD